SLRFLVMLVRVVVMVVVVVVVVFVVVDVVEDVKLVVVVKDNIFRHFDDSLILEEMKAEMEVKD
ncbi:hypothetical protein Tco_1571881, partial [Tanacetum coccineum]